MRNLRKPTTVEIATVLGVAAVLGAIAIMPDSATATRWQLERRARDWKHETVVVPADSSLIATNIDLTGEWIKEHRLTHSSFVFKKRARGQYDAQFATSGCLGGCNLSRTATVLDGVITLDGAVAEYTPRTYNTLYAIHVDDTAYLVPAEGIREVEQELTSGSNGWKWHVFSRRQ